VRKVAQDVFGGTVSLKSTEWVGTTFTVTFPIPPQRGVAGRTPATDT
jgi:hypothetical protein